jgi:hypothetical protein
MRRLTSAALIVLASGFSTPARAGGCDYTLGSYTNGFMPDFDQKRQPGPLFFDGMNYIPIPDGLPGSGFNYCSPTSHTNVMGYLANHGFPALMPGGSAAAWGSQANYERVTDAIQEMGVFMETDPDAGTTCCGFSGCVAYLDEHAPGKFVVSQQTADGFYAPTIGDLAFCAIAGGFVNVMVGWFEDTGVNTWQKTGGHVVTMVGLEGWCGGNRKIKIRDPGNDSSNLLAQSTFATNSYTLQQLPGFFDSNGTEGLPVYLQRTYERMVNYDTSDGRLGLINGYRVILPKYGVTLTPPPMQQLQLLNPIRPTHHPVAPIQQLPIKSLPYVIDFALSADGFSVLCIGRDAAGTPDPNVYRINRGSGEVLPFPIGGQPAQVETGRSGDRMFFADETGVIRFMVPSPQGPQVLTVTPSDPVDVIAYDDRTDTLIALAAAARRFHFFNPDGTSAGPAAMLPSLVALNGDPYIAVSPLDGSVWLRSRNSPSIYKIGFDRVLGPVVEDTANLPSTVGDIGIDIHVVQAREHILLARQVGVVADFVKNSANQWVADTGSDFAGLPAFGGIELARSRTNFDPATMDGPRNDEELPGGHGAPEWDCPGDVDENGVVGFSDVTGVLTMWGSNDVHPADADGSGGVGFSDVTLVLTNWGPCE